MGIRLIVEILDHAPEDLTAAERLVLIVLAEDANDGTRKGWPPVEVIADRAGLTVAGVGKVLRRLSERGYDVRLKVGTGKDGRPIYAYRGRQVNYALPKFPKRGSLGAEWRARGRPESPTSGVTLPDEKALPEGKAFTGERATLSTEKGLPNENKRPTPGVTPSPQSPHTIPSSSARGNEPSGSEPSPTDDDDEWGSTQDEHHATDGHDSSVVGDVPEGDGSPKDGSNEDGRAAAEVARRVGVSTERAQKVVDEIRHRFQPRNLTAYLAKMSGDKLRELESDIAPDVPHYFRRKPPGEMRTCPECDRAFRAGENYQTHCEPCMTAFLAGRKSKRQQETDDQFNRAMRRAEAREADTTGTENT